MPTSSYDRMRVRRILQAMTNEVCTAHPQYSLEEVWGHVDGAMQILNDTKVFARGDRYAIVADEYHVCHASD